MGLAAAVGLFALTMAAPRVGFTLRIVNPPAGGNYWQLVVYNEVWGDWVMAGTNIPVGQPITLEALLAGWSYPLYFELLIYEQDVSPYNVVYRVQSALGPDWPNYKDITIPGTGDYQFDCATGELLEV